MNKEYYVDKNHIVILLKQNSEIFQYSFNAKVWYNVPKLKGIENHPELVMKISEEEALEYIEEIEKIIEKSQNKKHK